jgi:cation transporter-like permease
VAYTLLVVRARHDASVTAQRRRKMLETIAIILIILWLLGMVSGYTLGNFIYVLLVIAIVLFLVRLISGRRV